MSKELRRAIALAAEGFEGTPFRHQGRVPGTGLDCGGVVVCAAWVAGLPFVDSKAYGRRPNPRRMIEVLEREMVRIDVEQAGDGDVLFFWFLAEHVPQHLGVLTTRKSRPHVVHAYDEIGKVVVVDRAAPDGPAGSVHSAWRYKGAL